VWKRIGLRCWGHTLYAIRGRGDPAATATKGAGGRKRVVGGRRLETDAVRP